MRRLLPPLALLALLAGCADPAAEQFFGFGDPVRAAGLAAPSMLGDTSRLAGQPARAARAVVQMEVLAEGFRSDPFWMHEVSVSAWNSTGLSRAELRAAIGIAADAPSDLVIAGLRDAAAALDAGSTLRAEAALTGPAFPAGGAATLSRLGRLPFLPRTAEAAGAAAAEIRRRDAVRRS
jgi:hypothetical protein